MVVLVIVLPLLRIVRADDATGNCHKVIRTDYGLFDTTDSSGVSASLCAEHFLVQSVEGLVAQAVVEHRSDELVWIGLGPDKDYSAWLAGLCRRLTLVDGGRFKPWELVARYRGRGIVKGYILYTPDVSVGELPGLRAGVDESVNVATTAAGILGGVLVSPALQAKAKALGLPLLLDARGKTPAWAFERFKPRLNRGEAMAQDPKLPQNRDIAIARRMFVLWGRQEPTESVYAWLRPGSSVYGWNGGDEGKMVSQLCEYGHTLVPSNWSENMADLSMVGGPPPLPFRPLDPKRIDFTDHRPAVSFVLSDGDNLQWMMGSFVHDQNYWASPAGNAFPFGFGVPAGQLQQYAPEVLDALRGSQASGTAVVQASDGYFYVDLLGSKLSTARRDAMLHQRGQELDKAMRQAGIRVAMLYCMDCHSADARNGYKVIARQLHGAAGLIAIQYSPYTAGAGVLEWVTDADGLDVPVLAAKYALWADVQQPCTGTPQQIAAMVSQDAARTPALLDWIVVHAWSSFPASSGSGADRGVLPALRCAQAIGSGVHVVGIEELLWRQRMRHSPQQTTKALAIH